MTDKENAFELYMALASLLDLIKSGKIKTPSIKNVVGDRSLSSLPRDSHGSSLWPDLGCNSFSSCWKPPEALRGVPSALSSLPRRLVETKIIDRPLAPTRPF